MIAEMYIYILQLLWSDVLNNIISNINIYMFWGKNWGFKKMSKNSKKNFPPQLNDRRNLRKDSLDNHIQNKMNMYNLNYLSVE